jgi:Transglutaminase-like superfamily
VPGVLEFYAAPGALTAAMRRNDWLTALPTDLGELTQLISRIGIYDVVAREFYGVEVPESRADEIHYRAVDDMLDRVLALDDAPPTGLRPPERRLFCRCRGYTQLLVAALRAHGLPARARCGFATYFNTGKFEDHWVAEVWNAHDRRWRLVDAQLDEVWQARLEFEGDALDIGCDRFLVAAEAWKLCRAGHEDPNRFGISFGGLRGVWFVANNLVRDLASLNKMEMLPWDVWGAQLPSDQPLDNEGKVFFDELAALTQDPEATFDALRERYQADERLRVPPRVFNALREQVEATH